MTLSTYHQPNKRPLVATMRAHIATSLSPSPTTAAPGLAAEPWLRARFPSYVAQPFAKRHDDLWAWVWAIPVSERPPPFVAIWPRGGGKSTTAELAVVAMATKDGKPLRAYALYVCATQEQADDHVANIATLFERVGADRAIGKYGNSKGWRRNRLRTSGGFTLDALGLDTLRSRGAKVDEDRPGFIVFDDIDGEEDTPQTTAKKIRAITKKILPAGAFNLAVLAIQNLVIPNGVFSRLADGRADFLSRRVVSGPFPAIENLSYEQLSDGTFRIEGEPTWEGQDLAACQAIVNDEGITAFLEESQHEVADPDGGMYSHLAWRRCRWADVPPLVRCCVWCDPAVTNTDDSDCHGVQADGVGGDGTIYRLFSWEQRTTPQDVLCRAILKALEYGAQIVGVETDQGGDTWQSVFNEAWRAISEERETEEGLDRLIRAHRATFRALQAQADRRLECPAFRSAKAGQGYGSKIERQSKMLSGYERGGIVHVEGTHLVLEKALRRFPKAKPYDLADAAFWGWNWLSGGGMSNSAVGAFG